ncbi:MAG: hypothetical protein IIX10_05620, partial [Clostridia bacterium]|nr:hypothetical protein [Clostridia bacterium]
MLENLPFDPTVPIAVLILLFLIIFVTNYRKVPPNIALVISGCIRRRYKVKDENGRVVIKKFGYRIVRGGATMII